MKIKLIKKDGVTMRKISESYNIKNFVTKEFSEKVSLAVSEAKNHQERTKNLKSDRIYYILEGDLIVKYQDKRLMVKEGDAIFIPANTEYNFEGTFKAIIINSPSFDVNDEVIQK